MLGRDVLRLGVGNDDGRERAGEGVEREMLSGRLRCENQGSRIERQLFERRSALVRAWEVQLCKVELLMPCCGTRGLDNS
jgi:hypothetical protein